MPKQTIPVLINQDGGTARADPAIADTIADALRAAGIVAAIESIAGSECAKRCNALARSGARTVIVGGGDGTVSAAASALAGTRTALGILPLGTLNHFARDLKIGADVEDAAKIIAAGKRTKVDIAEVNGRTFINNSAVGLYPLMVLDRDAQQQRWGRSKRLALAVASVRTLFRFRHQRLALAIDGDKERVDTPLLFVGNNDYRLDLRGAGTRRSITDGHLCVVAMAKNTRRGFLAAVARALLGRARKADLVRTSNVSELRVESHRSKLPITLDGEVAAMSPPLDYRIRPKALTVLAP